jgi:predicted transcriptional regulator
LAERPPTILEMTTDVVASYLQKNRVAESDLPGLIRSVYGAINGMGTPDEPEVEAVTMPTAAQIRKSIRPDVLISFIDGQPYKVMKRHLSTHGMNPASYRGRYGLPKDYPMVPPEYSARRSELAKANGLGAMGRNAKAKPAVARTKTVKPAKRTMKPVVSPTV